MQIIHVNLANGLGGGEYQTLALMEGLHHKADQWLIHRNSSPLAKLAREHSFSTMSAGNAFFSPLAACWSKPAILHAHDGRGVHWASLNARLHGLPYLITRRILKAPRQRCWTRSAYLGANHVACVSQAVADNLYDYSADLSTCVVYDGLVGFPSNVDRVAALRASHCDRLIVAQVGRLTVEKEVVVTLEVARRLASKKLPLQFWIIGDGPLFDSLKAVSTDLDNVEFVGHRPDVGDYLAAADVLIHPSRNEAFGSVIAEAMQHGVAVVASRVGGIPEVVSDNQTGMLIECGNVSGFSAAIEKMYNEPELRGQMAEAGRRRAQLFSLDVMTKRYLELYTQCLEMYSKGKQ